MELKPQALHSRTFGGSRDIAASGIRDVGASPVKMVEHIFDSTCRGSLRGFQRPSTMDHVYIYIYIYIYIYLYHICLFIGAV